MSSENIIISIIVCCYNENDYIDRCLDSLLSQKNIPGPFEILVIDGMSNDGTREKIVEKKSKHLNIRVFDNPAKVKPPAINIGFRNARGKYIAICDAHTIYTETYLSNCVDLLNVYPDVNCVGGPIISIGDTSFGKANAIAMSSRIGVGNAKHRFPDYEGYAEMACFPLFRRNVLETVGLYDEFFVINHDDEYCFRLRKAGGKVYISHKAKCYYFVRKNPKSLFKQYFAYGLWQIAFLKKHREPISLRQLVPATFFSIVILMILISFFTQQILIALILPLVYVAVLSLSAVPIIFKHGLKVAIQFPLAIFILHFAYATGFVSGLIKFRKYMS